MFYAITASSNAANNDRQWVKKSRQTNQYSLLRCWRIRSLAMAEDVLANGADKISINSPALENPDLIEELAKRLGSQCVVIGIDSWNQDGEYQVLQYTGDENKTIKSRRNTLEWARGSHEPWGEIYKLHESGWRTQRLCDLEQTRLFGRNSNNSSGGIRWCR